MENEDLRLGRISKKVERGLGISLPFGAGVYLRSWDMDLLVSRYPDRYLLLLEQMRTIMNRPCLSFFDQKAESIYLFKRYGRKQPKTTVGIRIAALGKPKRWWIRGMRSYEIEEMNRMKSLYPFAEFGN
ncbi:MAG: hypothetical protein Q4F15_04095 [Bacillota bacterium]|nr:hypothetical protein [Bacillota bacterium]